MIIQTYRAFSLQQFTINSIMTTIFKIAKDPPQTNAIMYPIRHDG